MKAVVTALYKGFHLSDDYNSGSLLKMKYGVMDNSN